MKSAAALALLGALYGCSSGGFLPNGPHTMGSVPLAQLVASESRAQHISPALVAAIVDAESHGDPSAISRAGAEGLMQLMPETARTYGVRDAFDPEQNVAGGCRYVRVLLARYHHDVPLALAAYNAGPGAVDAAHGVPDFPETRAYVARVVGALRTNG